MQEPARRVKRQRKRGTRSVPAFPDQLCFLVVQQLHHRYLVGGALLAARVGLLDVGAALHAALKRQAVAHLHFCDLGGDLSPRDAGQIVRAPIAAVDRQDHIADAAPQRRAPQRRLLAQHAREQDAVEVPAVARLDGLGKGGDDQTAAVPAAVVERAELSGHAQGRALCNVDALQQSGGGEDERQVALPGQALHAQRKAVEALAVILVRKGGSRAGCAPKLHIVLTFFHSVHLKVCCWCSL